MKEVHKFGGTSVDRLDQIIRVIADRKTYHPYVCVSAFSGVTDVLLQFIEKAENQDMFTEEMKEHLKSIHLKKIQEGVESLDACEFLQKQFLSFFESRFPQFQSEYQSIVDNGFSVESHDAIMGFGEQISAFVVASFLSWSLKIDNYSGKFIDLGNIVLSSYKEAGKIFKEELKHNIAQILIEKKQENEIPVITGYFGKVPGGILNAIDRGYTDYCGAMVASIVKADRFIIFKEVDGVCSTDPRIVTEDCLLLEELSYVEVLKMASAGMKAVNTEAVKPAMQAGIMIEVRNTFHPELPGTKILAKRALQSNRIIQNIPIKKDVCIIRFGGFITKSEDNLELKLMQILDKYQIKKFFSTTDCAGTSVVISQGKKVSALLGDLRILGEVKIVENCAIVAIVGEEMNGKIGVLAQATAAIASTGTSIYMVAQGASEIGIDFVVPESSISVVVESLHSSFFS